ncbi:hypothetical protein ES702_06024 [subsurface metagenome]
MQNISFSIPISGVINFDRESITLTINRTETTIHIEPETPKGKHILLEPGKSLYDLVLETARQVVKDEFEENQFTAAQLYHTALDRYPNLNLKRNSWNSHVIGSAPNHPSYHHFSSSHRYFRYLGEGKYSLDPNIDL